MKYKISDVASINESSISKGTYIGSVNYVDTSSVINGDFNGCRHYPSISEAPSRARRLVSKEDTIISTVRPNMKHVGFISSKSNCIYSTGFAVVSPKKNKIDPYYLYLFLSSNRVTKILQSIGETSTSTYPSVKPSDIGNLVIDMPPLDEQHLIANRIRLIDEKKNQNRQINANLLELLDTEFQHRFMNKNHSTGQVQDYVSIKRGSSPRPIKDYLVATGRPWVKISDVTSLDNPFLYKTGQFIKKEGISKSRTVNPGTLIISNSATPGIPVISQILASVHDGWLIVSDYKLMNRNWFYLFFRQMRRALVARANGSVFNNLKTDIVKQFPVPIINNPELIEFNNFSEPIFQKLNQIHLENIELREIKNALLKRSF